MMRKHILIFVVVLTGFLSFSLSGSFAETSSQKNSDEQVRMLPQDFKALPSVDGPVVLDEEQDERHALVSYNSLVSEPTTSFALHLNDESTRIERFRMSVTPTETLQLNPVRGKTLVLLGDSPRPETFEKEPVFESAIPESAHFVREKYVQGVLESQPVFHSDETKGEILLVQRGGLFGAFRRPDSSSSDNKTYENSETRPFTPTQKASEVSSNFVFDSEDTPRRTPVESTARNGSNGTKSEINTGSSADWDEPFMQALLNRSRKVKLDPNSVGNPHSATLVRMMYDEVMNGLKKRGVTGRYDMFRNYCRSTLDRFAAVGARNEFDGLARLSWYDHLFRDPVRSVFEVEEFSRTMHAGLSGDHRHYVESLAQVRRKLDIPARNSEVYFSEAKTPQQAVAEVQRCITNAQASYARAISTLSVAEQRELANNLYPTFAGNVVNGHTIPARGTGRRLISLMRKMDRTGIHEATEALAPLTDEHFLKLLATLPEDAFPSVSMGSQRVQKISTAAGDILIGGRGNNVYDLDAPSMMNIVCVIDLGGNDVYREGTCNINRPVFVIIDLGGDDQFIASKPGVQGASILGVSMLLSLSGKDVFVAKDVAQGSTLGGAGILINYAGDDSYTALRRGQGTALGGIGILIDKKGHDKYRAALFGQGLGHPDGFGALEDCEGNDGYYVGGLYLDYYPEHPGYDGWGQGMGAGIRQVANGGVGMLLDGAGDDSYEYDYFAHGGGYWLGVGFARDFGGNDTRHGATLLDYYGKKRGESRWQRFSCGFGCHYSIGFCFDDEGDDVYSGTIMSSGMAWDLAAGFLLDLGGNDRFDATGGLTKGAGAEAGFGVLFNYGGDDKYIGRSFGYAPPAISYHSPSSCGSNFSFLVDYGGKDEYKSAEAANARVYNYNNSEMQQGSSGGFLIDRPFDVEAAADKAAAEKAAAEKAVADKAAAEKAAAERANNPRANQHNRNTSGTQNRPQNNRSQAPRPQTQHRSYGW